MVEHWAAAFREFSPTLKKTGWYPTYLKEGEPTRSEQMRLTLARMGIDEPETVAALSAAYASNRNANLRLFDDAIEVLDALHAKFPLGLITNGPADIQRQEIATLGIGHYFDIVWIEGEMGRGKPIPEVFETIAGQAKCEPHEIAMVGNSYAHDIRPALEAGWAGVWIRRPSDVPPSHKGFTAKPEALPEGAPEPHATIARLSELLPLFGLAGA